MSSESNTQSINISDKLQSIEFHLKQINSLLQNIFNQLPAIVNTHEHYNDIIESVSLLLNPVSSYLQTLSIELQNNNLLFQHFIPVPNVANFDINNNLAGTHTAVRGTANLLGDIYTDGNNNDPDTQTNDNTNPETFINGIHTYNNILSLENINNININNLIESNIIYHSSNIKRKNVTINNEALLKLIQS